MPDPLSESEQESNSPVSGYYEDYTETQKEIFSIEIRKCRNLLLWLAAIFFISDLVSIAISDALTPVNLGLTLVVPALLAGLALLSRKEPMMSVILAGLLVLALWIFTFIVAGVSAAITGWLVRALIIYLVLAAFQSAREAARIKRELHL